MSKVDLCASTSGSVLLMNALSAKYGTELFDKLGIDVGEVALVDVKLTVNGEELEFLGEIDKFFNYINDELEKTVLKRAKELLSASRLDKLSQLLDDIEWKVGDELQHIQKVLGV